MRLLWLLLLTENWAGFPLLKVKAEAESYCYLCSWEQQSGNSSFHVLTIQFSAHIWKNFVSLLKTPNYSLTAFLMFKNLPCIWKWYPKGKWQKSFNFMLPVCPSHQRSLLQKENLLKPKQKEKMLCGSCMKHIHKLLFSKVEIRLEILPILSNSCTELCMSNNLYKLLEISPFICKTSSYKKNLQFSKCINPFPTEVRSMAINLSLRVLQNTSWICYTV